MIKVALRKKKISKGRVSLYLDFYPAIVKADGTTTRREFLKVYLTEKPTTPLERLDNKEQMNIAVAKLGKRTNELSKPEVYTEWEKSKLADSLKGEKDFLEYFRNITNTRIGSNKDVWEAAQKYLENYAGVGKLMFKEVDEEFAKGFAAFLLNTQTVRSSKTKVSNNTAVSYFNKFKAALKQAFKDGILSVDINGRIAPIKYEDTKREALTKEELTKLKETECKNPMLKNAALFSALSGLRFCDIKKMTWREIESVKEGERLKHFVNFTQQKTKAVEHHPINEQAFRLLGERRDPNLNVFQGLEYSAYENRNLAHWIGLAGITKDITFHNFRHSYATLMLNRGIDIYTVSKMLGHKNVKTTSIYAKVVDSTKRVAADSLNDIEF